MICKISAQKKSGVEFVLIATYKHGRCEKVTPDVFYPYKNDPGSDGDI